jgi:hypothetical protein
VIFLEKKENVMNKERTKKVRGTTREGCALFAAICLLLFSGCGQLEQSENEDTEETDNKTTVSGVESTETGIMTKGSTRQFSVSTGDEAIWTVEGTSPGAGTAINAKGLLIVGTKETGITLTVKAASAESNEELGTAAVKVKGWKEITGNLADIFCNLDNGGGTSIGVDVLAYSSGLNRWVMAGGGLDSTINTIMPVVAYSDDDGETWVQVPNPPLIEEEKPLCIIYDGPEGDKKFIIGGYRGHIIYSSDGETWKKVKNILQFFLPTKPDPPNPIRHIVYGTVDGEETGRYIATGSGGEFAYSPDGITWTKGENMPGGKSMKILYGSGDIDGNRAKMFFAQWIAPQPGSGAVQEDDVNLYSSDGINWEGPLTEEELGTLHFTPTLTNGGYRDVPMKAVAMSGSMFKGTIFAKAENESFAYFNEYVDGKYIMSKYNNKVSFTAYGNGKYIGVGMGRRAVIAHEESFDQ